MKKIILIALASVIALTISAQALKVTQDGKVGIGTAVPAYKFDVNGFLRTKGNIITQTGASASASYERTDGAAFALGGGAIQGTMLFDQDYSFEIRSTDRDKVRNRILNSGNARLRINGVNGYVGIGTTTPGWLLHVNGDAAKPGGGSWTTASDRRLKKNIKNYQKGLDAILKINPVEYEYNGHGGIQMEGVKIGIIAQEFAKVEPLSVTNFVYRKMEERKEGGVWKEKATSEKEYLAVDESSITYMLVNAIKEQHQIIEDQNVRIAKLEQMVMDLAENSINSNDQKEKLGSALAQNAPNPFTSSTSIAYNLPADATHAQLIIKDIRGTTVHEQAIEDMGDGSLDYNGSSLQAGTYYYQLVADGQILDSKKMVVAK